MACRQFIFILRAVYIDCGITFILFLFLFLFFKTYALFIRPNSKIRCRSRRGRGGLRSNFFHIFLLAGSQENMKQNCRRRSTMTRSVDIYLIFREGVFLVVLIFITIFQTSMCFKREICACVFLTFWKSSIHLSILPNFFNLFK